MHRALLRASMTHELNISGSPIGSHPISSGRPSTDAQLLEAMVEGASEGLVLLSADSLVLHANRAAVGMIGGDHVVIGRPIHEVFASSIAEALSTHLVVTRTHQLPDGRSVLVAARPVMAGAARVLLTFCD